MSSLSERLERIIEDNPGMFFDNEERTLREAASALAAGPVAVEPVPVRMRACLEAALVSKTAVGDAARDVLAERRRQVESEGWSPEHDDKHTDNELSRAAGCYALGVTAYWPWDQDWWKPSDRRRNLVKAGALILAEIERLDRLPARPNTGEADA